MSDWKTYLYYHSPTILQSTMISAYRYARRPFELGSTFREYQGLLNDSQWWSRDQLELWQLERLQRLIAHAYERVPGYRKRFNTIGIKPTDIQTIADLTKLPILTKEEVRSDRADFVADNAKVFRPVTLNTSGTTGTPFQFFSDRETEAIEWAFNWRHKGWGGARTWEPMISLGGKVVVPLSQRMPPFWRYNRAENILWLSAFHMTSENLDLYIEQIRKSGVRFLRGYPSNLNIFAQHLVDRSVRLPMQSVFTGSEPLFDHVRTLIEDRFACKVFDWYGVSERGVTASQCDRHNGYHVHMENCLVEILRGDAPVGPGEIGEIVATCLSNYAMPLIRYRTGDVSSWQAESCPCGRTLATIDQVQTKWEHVVRTPDGRWISPSVLTHPFKPVRGIRKSQVVQEELDYIVIRLVADHGFDISQRELLVRGFRERLGSDIRIDIVQLAEIPNDPSGKYRWIISKVPTEINARLDLARWTTTRECGQRGP